MEEFANEVTKTVLAIATPVIASLVAALLVKALKKIGLSVDAEREAKLEKIARDAIIRAEEWAASKIKVSPGSITAGNKLEKALVDITDRVPGISRDEASALVHANLAKVGVGATVAVQDFRVAATTGAP